MTKYSKVLLVHPDEDTRELLKAKIQGPGTTVKSVANGVDGFITARIERFDLIVCAVDLPVMSGIEMVKSIHLQPSNREVPVVFIGVPGHPNWLPLPGQQSARILTAEEFIEGDLEKHLEENGVK